jgi:hypothetical protein
MREPIHLSISSVHPSLRQSLGVDEETGGSLPRGKIWEAIQGVWRVTRRECICPSARPGFRFKNNKNIPFLHCLCFPSYTQHNMRYLKCLKCRRIMKQKEGWRSTETWVQVLKEGLIGSVIHRNRQLTRTSDRQEWCIGHERHKNRKARGEDGG